MRRTTPKNNNKLWKLREAYGFTRPQFSKIVGISVSSLQAYEEDRNKLTISAKNKIARATGISTAYFELDSINAKEAIEQSNTNANELLRANKEVNYCVIYNGLSEFVAFHPQNYYYENDKKLEQIEVNSNFLASLFGIDDISEYSFIKVKGNEAEPFADSGETLIIKSILKSHKEANTEIVKNNEWLVVQRISNNAVFLRQYRYLSKNATNIAETTITDSDLDEVHILGVVKAKISMDRF